MTETKQQVPLWYVVYFEVLGLHQCRCIKWFYSKSDAQEFADSVGSEVKTLRGDELDNKWT